MAERIQKQKVAAKTEVVSDEVTAPPEAADLTITDELLDEIDAVLEENAAEFVAQYVQKGGQ